MSKNKAMVQNEGFHRINYLYQAAHIMLKVAPRNSSLSQFYTHTLSAIAKKSVTKLDPSLKRTLCKKCSCLQVVGVTATARIRGKHGHTVTCLMCQTMKYFPGDFSYRIWSERQEAWVGPVPEGLSQDRSASIVAMTPVREDLNIEMDTSQILNTVATELAERETSPENTHSLAPASDDKKALLLNIGSIP